VSGRLQVALSLAVFAAIIGAVAFVMGAPA